MMKFYFFIRLMQIVVPWLVRSIVGTVNFMLTILSSIWVGIPQATDGIAGEWVRRATAAGVPTIWDRRLYFTIRVLAFATIVLGWVLVSFFTVWIVKWIF